MAPKYHKTFAVIIEPVDVKKPKYLRQTRTKNVNPKQTLAPGYPKIIKIQKSNICQNFQITSPGRATRCALNISITVDVKPQANFLMKHIHRLPDPYS